MFSQKQLYTLFWLQRHFFGARNSTENTTGCQATSHVMDLVILVVVCIDWDVGLTKVPRLFYLARARQSCINANGYLSGFGNIQTFPFLTAALAPTVKCLNSAYTQSPSRHNYIFIGVASRAEPDCVELRLVVTCIRSYDTDTFWLSCVGPHRKLSGKHSYEDLYGTNASWNRPQAFRQTEVLGATIKSKCTPSEALYIKMSTTRFWLFFSYSK